MGIIAEHLGFSYGETRVLDDINLMVSTGERIAIIGASGGGKSTLLKLLAGLYAPKEGYVEVEGARNPIEIRRNVSVVMQSAMLLPASIYDNVACGRRSTAGRSDATDADVRSALDAAQLTEWIATLPEGVQTFVGERGGRVSGGQAQRIAIARAMFKSAPVVLLDEPTSALDTETGDAVLEALRRLTESRTVVSVTHKTDILADCDRVYLLEKGRLRDA